MQDKKYDPPESIFDEIEPVAYVVFLIALFTIISFTPLSPFANRDQSALDQLAGVNAIEEARQSGRRNSGSRMQQVEAHIEFFVR